MTNPLFEDIVEELIITEHASRSQMMGHPTLMANQYMFACYIEAGMMFRLKAGSENHAQALALEGSHLFNPMQSGTGMKEWVVVTPAHADQWRDLAKQALTYVRSLPPKKPRKPKKKFSE